MFVYTTSTSFSRSLGITIVDRNFCLLNFNFSTFPPWTLLGYSQGNECITNTGTVSIGSGIQVVIGNILCEPTQCHLKLVKNLGMCLITSHVNQQLKHGIVVGNVLKMQNEQVQLGCIESCLESHLEYTCM
jgi:hypothetical protein